MTRIKVKFSDGSEQPFKQGLSLNEILKEKDGALAGKVLAAQVEGQPRDMS